MEKESFLLSNITTKEYMLHTRSLCAVCGAPAIGRNFDAMTCLSCKAFFRRNAYNEQLTYSCRVASSCEITITTRRHCSACRLKKCFQQGMKKELIRSLNAISHATSAALNSRPHYRSIQLTTVDSIRSDDHTILSLDEWNLITNIRNAYDLYCVQKFIESHQTISLVPPVQPYRSRIKLQRLFDLRFKYTIIIASFIKRILQFDNFQSATDNHYQYVKNSLQCLTSVNASELRKSNVLKFFPWEHDRLVFQYVLSDEFIQRAEKYMNAFENMLSYDPVIMKLWILILALSPQNLPLFRKDRYNSMDFDSFPNNLFLSQNYYLTLLWKYVLYRLGHHDAVFSLSDLYKIFFVDKFLKLI
ncbi:hypothetical protein I4U23_008781 [Adineta vaga]|nr:hypothetical protein I4U23_008781 [Adineta vaga]